MKAGPAPRWSVYVVRCRDGALYTGIATDVRRRLRQHRAGKGAKALRGRGPLRLLLARAVGDRGVAQVVEAAIKRLRKAQKERLLAAPRRLLLHFAAAALDARA